jgi:predicted nucleic acid-binding Zn ribbon protein
MFCMNCGRELEGNPETCLSCGARPLGGGNFCPECGARITPETEICSRCGTKVGEKVRTRGSTTPLVVGGILSMVSGALGVYSGIYNVLIAQGIVTVEDDEGTLEPGVDFAEGTMVAIGLAFLVTGIVAIIGGSFAVRKKRFGLAMAGAICSVASSFTVCLGLPGIAAVVLVAISKNKFNRQERKSDVLHELR